MSEIVSKPDHGDTIIENGVASFRFQLFLDDLEERFNNFLLGAVVIVPEYTVLTVPAASDYDNGVIIVSDETGGRTLATSDGANWRRVSDGAIIS